VPDSPRSQHFVRPTGSPPVNGYSHAVAFSGPMVVVSGQLPVDAEGQLVGRDDPAAQTTQVFENLAAALAAAGTTMDHLVKLTVFLTDLGDLADFRRIRDRYISMEHPPASSVVQVSALLNPAFRIEIEAIAAT
jgi:reactive intermediate/imine deaminase